MITEEFVLNPEKNVRLVRYGHCPSPEIPYRKKRPAVVVCPGGGYFFCSDREADPVALRFLAEGYQVFVLYYRLGEDAVFPGPLLDLCGAMKFIREHAEEFGVIPEKIAVCGFSAGGHLAASLGVYWNAPDIREKSGCLHGENRPDALILGYPVISTSWIENDGSLARLIGQGDYAETYRRLNLHTAVTADTPQCFLVHTVRDSVVPVEDSIRFASALIQAGVPCELHIFPNGDHGLSLSNGQVCEDGGDPSFARWTELAADWLRRKWEHPQEAGRPLNKARYSSRL